MQVHYCLYVHALRLYCEIYHNIHLQLVKIVTIKTIHFVLFAGGKKMAKSDSPTN